MNWLLRFRWYRRWRGVPEPSISAVEITNAALAMLSDVLGNMDAVNKGWDRTADQKTIAVRKPRRYVGNGGEAA